MGIFVSTVRKSARIGVRLQKKEKLSPKQSEEKKKLGTSAKCTGPSNIPRPGRRKKTLSRDVNTDNGTVKSIRKSTATAESTPENTPKGRPRGRPKGTFKSIRKSTATAESTPENAPKGRPRGRPKGSVKKKVSPESSAKITTSRQIMNSATTSTKTPTKSLLKRSAKSAANGSTKSSSKNSANGSAKSSTKDSANSSVKCAAKGWVKTTPKSSVKRKTEETSNGEEPVTTKRKQTNVTPSPTPRVNRRATDSTKSNEKKAKNSAIQFDYGVPSPIETERESVDDEDSPSQAEAKAAQRAVVAATRQGQSIRIPLDPPKPFTFRSEQARKLWEQATKERGDYIKGLIESRDFVPDWLKRQLEGSLEFTTSQTRNILTEDKSRRTQGMLKWLQAEEKILDLDAEIKSSLKKEFLGTDLDQCIASLEKLCRIPVDPLTLKKYPQLATTPCLLQKYKGCLTQWTLTSQETESFVSKREVLWEKAKELQQKYMELFGIEDDLIYVQVFQQKLETFRNAVANLTEDEISLLVHDPSAKKVARSKIPAS